MPQEYYILIVGYIFGFYMAWNIGANDVANSMASSVGAKAITIRQAIFLAGILNIIGAVFIGSHVTNTIRDLCTTSKKIDVSIKIFRSCVNFLIKSPINSNKKDIMA